MKWADAEYFKLYKLQFVAGHAYANTDSVTGWVVNQTLLAKLGVRDPDKAIGKYIKVNDTWLQVVGVLNEQLMAGAQSSGGAMQDINNIVYIPRNTIQYRFWDQSFANLKDDLDGV